MNRSNDVKGDLGRRGTACVARVFVRPICFTCVIGVCIGSSASCQRDSQTLPARPSPFGHDAGAEADAATDDGAGDATGAPAPVWPGGDGSPGLPAAPDVDAPRPDPPPSPPGDAATEDSAALDSSSAAGPDASCSQSLGPGDLMIDELMIESVAGTGDYGEWLEVRSAAPCAVDLNGLHGECPVGMKVHTFDIGADVWLLPGGTFVVADSSDPAIDHDLPQPLVTWAGAPGDVLRNLGGTVTLTVGGVVVDSVTFPSLKPKVGASIAFPSDCPASRRTDFSAWQTSTSSWFPGFYGTPNAVNDDVSCP